jgi:hypothetical protein
MGIEGPKGASAPVRFMVMAPAGVNLRLRNRRSLDGAWQSG